MANRRRDIWPDKRGDRAKDENVTRNMAERARSRVVIRASCACYFVEGDGKIGMNVESLLG